MNAVDPIKDTEKIVDIADYLYAKCLRDWLLFLFGIYTAYRISDILRFKVRDVRDIEVFEFRDTKTGKMNKLVVHEHLKWAIDLYIEGKPGHEYLFKSRERNKDGVYKPITRQQAYMIIRKAAKYFGLKNVGCHTLRKTWGYQYYDTTGDIMTVKEVLMHSTIEYTKIYIGITQESKFKAIKSMDYGFDLSMIDGNKKRKKKKRKNKKRNHAPL